MPGYLGKSLSGPFRTDYAYLIESSNSIKWSLANLTYDGFTLGQVKYTPTVAPDNVYEWKDQWQYMTFETTGGTATGYSTRRLSKGIYAIVAIEGNVSAGGVTMHATARINGGTYTDSGTLIANTANAWEHAALSNPILVRVDETHDEIGVHVSAVAGGANFKANILSLIHI
jgi:hypothetical protein